MGIILATNRSATESCPECVLPGAPGSSIQEGEPMAICTPADMSSRRSMLTLSAILKRLNNTLLDSSKAVSFEPSDLDQLGAMLHLAAHFVKISKLYDGQKRTTKRFEALLELLSNAGAARCQTQELNDLVNQILIYSHDMFECDRCT